jgi:hypothetical protein
MDRSLVGMFSDSSEDLDRLLDLGDAGRGLQNCSSPVNLIQASEQGNQ